MIVRCRTCSSSSSKLHHRLSRADSTTEGDSADDISSESDLPSCGVDEEYGHAAQQATGALGNSAAGRHLQEALRKFCSKKGSLDIGTLGSIIVQGIVGGVGDVMEKAVAKQTACLSEILNKHTNARPSVSEGV